MSLTSGHVQQFDEALILRLAREIARGLNPIETILHSLQITPSQYQTIRSNGHFQKILTQELADWHAASNTSERVKLKSAAMVEEALPEMWAILHNRTETLTGRVELFKMIAKLGGQGVSGAEVVGGPGFRLTINIGAGQSMTLTSGGNPHASIEPEPLIIDHEGVE